MRDPDHFNEPAILDILVNHSKNDMNKSLSYGHDFRTCNVLDNGFKNTTKQKTLLKQALNSEDVSLLEGINKFNTSNTLSVNGEDSIIEGYSNAALNAKEQLSFDVSSLSIKLKKIKEKSIQAYSLLCKFRSIFHNNTSENGSISKVPPEICAYSHAYRSPIRIQIDQ